MDCFLEGPNFLVINPDECIDCAICVAECPVDAIVADSDIAPDQAHFVELNRVLANDPRWKRITAVKEPLPDHARWARERDKFGLLLR